MGVVAGAATAVPAPGSSMRNTAAERAPEKDCDENQDYPPAAALRVGHGFLLPCKGLRTEPVAVGAGREHSGNEEDEIRSISMSFVMVMPPEGKIPGPFSLAPQPVDDLPFGA